MAQKKNYETLLSEAQAAVDAYNADVNTYGEKVDAYNTLAGKVKTENDPAPQAASEDPEAPKSYNEQAQDFNKAIGAYNDRAADFTTKKETYKTSVENYATSVTNYNTAVGKYNEAADKYNLKAADWNAKEENSDQRIWNKIKDQQEKNIEVFKEVNHTLKTDTNGTAASALTQEQVIAYNAVVEAYNAEVQAHNNQALVDANNFVKQTFKNQSTHESWGVTGSRDTWYTAGKIYVGDIFTDNTENIFNNNACDDTAYHSTQGKDLYYWDETASGVKLVDKTKSEDNMYEADKGISNLEQRLFTGTSNQLNTTNLNPYGETIVSQSGTVGVDQLTAKGVEKWVLKLDHGASCYINDTSTASLHLDGYLYVEKLGTLAKLEARKQTVEPTVAVDVNAIGNTEVSTFGTETAPVALKTAAHYTKRAPVGVTPSADAAEGFEAGFEFKPYILKPIPTQIQKNEPEPEPEPDDPVDPVDPDDPDDPVDPVDPEVEIPDEDVPLTEVPVVEVPYSDMSLAEEPVVEIPDGDVPLAEEPVVDIPDEDVPLADVPETGDISCAWYAMAVLSACGLMALYLLKKREEA